MDKFEPASLANSNAVVFEASITGGPVMGGVISNEGLFVCTGGDGNCHNGTGTLLALVRRGDVVPDRAGREFCGFFGVSASSFGAAFRASTRLDCSNTGETQRFGIFRKTFGGAIETVALESESSNPVPAPGGTTYNTVLGIPSINDSGVVAFRATTGGVLSENGIYRCGGACPGGLAELVIAQGQTDGLGNVLRQFSDPAIASDGDVAFSCRGQGASGALTGVYIIDSAANAILKIALTGEAVPGVPGNIFKALGKPSMSGLGKLAFLARIRGDVKPRNRDGIFIYE
jgi:hypothetical protein